MITAPDHKCVLSIGNFDGVHRGHAALLTRARAVAEGLGLPLHVLTFEPHPRTFFAPDAPPFRITGAPAKTARLQACGADKVITLDFNATLAAMPADDFINDILIGRLGAAHIVVGSDFHFGKGRAGTIGTLQAHPYLDATPVTLLGDDLAAISSTRIRQALLDGNIDAAGAMLGWEWAIEGEVIHGDKRGREIGFPTANIAFAGTIAPAFGIYAVRVDIGDGIWRAGAANIGLRPMFALPSPLLEAYLFDFDGDLYGKTLRVRPVQRLRGEENFATLDALIAQIAKDCTDARDILISRP